MGWYRHKDNEGMSKTKIQTCWLCRLIGHKWLTTRKCTIDALSMSDAVLWGCCVRCGQPTPDAIMDVQ